MELFKCIYIWKSLQVLVPSLGLQWSDQSMTRMGSTLIPNKLKGKVLSARTLQKASIGIEGVRIFNSLPESIKKWSGTQDSFKEMLDRFLEKIPDNPITETLIPEARDIYRHPSNSIPDWVRKLSGSDISFQLEDVVCDSNICNLTTMV